MSESKKWHECNHCEKKLGSYKSLWRHKKICKFNVDNTSTSNDRSAICSTKQDDLLGNAKDTEFNAYIDQIINGSVTSDQNQSQDKQVVNEDLPLSSFVGDELTLDKIHQIHSENYSTNKENRDMQESDENKDNNNESKNMLTIKRAKA